MQARGLEKSRHNLVATMLAEQMVEEALQDQRMPVYTSEKNRSKRLRWI